MREKYVKGKRALSFALVWCMVISLLSNTGLTLAMAEETAEPMTETTRTTSPTSSPGNKLSTPSAGTNAGCFYVLPQADKEIGPAIRYAGPVS